nr:hypothetical protein [Tanacetum cinerariifolium]
METNVSQTLEYRGGQLNADPVLEDFQDSTDNEEDVRSSQEYMNDLKEEYQLSEHKPELKHTKDFEAKYNKVKAKLALLSSSASTSNSSLGKNKGLIAETYEWDEEEVSSDENEGIEVKALLYKSNKCRLSEAEDSTLPNHDTGKVNQYHTGQGEYFSRSRPSRPAISFPACIHYGFNDHQSDDCVYYPICKLYRRYDHDTHGHNMIISLRREIKPRDPQHVTKNCETCGSNVHTIIDHNDIEWFRKREAL